MAMRSVGIIVQEDVRAGLIVPTLLSVVEPRIGGDPMGRTKFVRRSLRTLAADLAARGFSICATSVARLLRDQGYSPRINVKRFTGPDHPDRDRQFLNIQEWIGVFTELGQPILSVDGKKKELIGNFKNAGAVWRRDAGGESTSTISPPTPSAAPPPTASTTCSLGEATSGSEPRRTPRRSPSRRSRTGGRGTDADATPAPRNC